MIAFVLLLFSPEKVAQFVGGRTKRLSHPFVSLYPKAGMWEGLRCVLSMENPLFANMSQQRME